MDSNNINELKNMSDNTILSANKVSEIANEALSDGNFTDVEKKQIADARKVLEERLSAINADLLSNISKMNIPNV